MISRRNYVIILIVMGIVFFLFQFSQIIRDYQNDYSYNEYADISVGARHEFVSLVERDSNDTTDLTDNYVVFFGDGKSDEGSIVSQWATYSKRDLVIFGSPLNYVFDDNKKPRFVLVDSDCVDFDRDLEKFEEMTDKGVSIVFLNLPTPEVIEKNKELMHLLGISEVAKKSVTTEGMKLFSGFMLGGETIYRPEKKSEERRQDLDLTMPWYYTAGGTKTYMVGLLDSYYDEDYVYKNDLFPAVIWRNSFGNAQVFCVNGDYMSGTGGLGILSSMIYELSPYQLYPVVNAQNTLVVDFPIMANENEDEFFSIYSRSLSAFQTDVVWPTLITLAEKDELKYTCLMTPKYDYLDPAEPMYDNYTVLLKLFGERDAEVGLSFEHADGITLTDKLALDKVYYDGIENRYPSTSAFMDLDDLDELDEALKDPYFSGVRTIACDEDVQVPVLSYLNEDITLQSLTSNTKNFAYSKDIMLKSIETALGYDNAKMDMGDVAWPEGDDDHWENIYNDMGSSLSTYWKPFRAFDLTTLTESDARVRTFLNISFNEERKGDEITLDVEGRDGKTAYFILRTHGEKIDGIEGAEYSKIEEDAFLLKINEDKVTIALKQTEKLD